MTQEIQEILARNLAAEEVRLTAACRRAGRARSELTLVAVTKAVSPEVAAVLPRLGVVNLGESRPQELWRKADRLPPTIRWHLIGHMQRNKIERTVPLVHLIHSVDSLRLLLALDEATERSLPVLLEVNASREANKQGFAPEELAGLAGQFMALKKIRIQGLMTMAAP
jgi:hypothetical protein